MKRRQHTFGVVAGFAASLMAFAAPAHAGKDDDTLRVAWQREISSFDFYFQAGLQGTIAHQHICDTLIWRDLDTQEFRPLLASAWEWSDPQTLELTLREDVTFHNGDAFNADDVVYTLSWASDPATGVSQPPMVNWIESVEKIDDYEVRIHTKEPNVAVLDLLATGVPIYPHKYHSEVGSNGFSAAPVCTGPYKVQTIEPGAKVVLTKNENYFPDSPKGTPSIGTIEIRYIMDANVRMGELMAGQIDWLGELSADQAERLAQVPGLDILERSSTYFHYIALKGNRLEKPSPIEDIRVRKAIAHAINRDSIVENLARGVSKRLDTYCHPILKGCVDGVAAIPYDPEMARKLLAEAGYPNGFSIDIYAYRDRQITEAVVGDLRNVGIEANINYLQFQALWERWNTGRMAMGHITWGGLGGLMDVSSTLSNYFLGGTHDPANDPAIAEEIRKGNQSMDEEVRFKHYANALEMLGKGIYWVPLFTSTERYAYTKDLDYRSAVNGVNLFYMSKWK